MSHLLRNTFRYAARQHWEAMAKDIKPVYTAVNAEQAAPRLNDFAQRWNDTCPAAIRLWRNAWNEVVPFLDYGGCCTIACPGF